MFPIRKQNKNIKIKIYDDNQPVFKAKGDKDEVRKKINKYFQFK